MDNIPISGVYLPTNNKAFGYTHIGKKKNPVLVLSDGKGYRTLATFTDDSAAREFYDFLIEMFATQKKLLCDLDKH